MSARENAKINEEPETLYADGFDEALIGITTNGVAVYDVEKMINVLKAQGMDEEDADEYLCYNTFQAHVGDFTPIYMINCED